MGYGVMGILSWRGLVTPNFQRPLAAKLCVRSQHFWKCKNVLEVITMPSLVGARISPAAGAAKNVQLFVCLFAVCLSICLSRFWRTSKFVRPISPWTRWNTETILMPLDRGRFVVVHLCSHFSDCHQLETSLNAEVQKRQKIGVLHCHVATE